MATNPRVHGGIVAWPARRISDPAYRCGRRPPCSNAIRSRISDVPTARGIADHERGQSGSCSNAARYSGICGFGPKQHGDRRFSSPGICSCCSAAERCRAMAALVKRTTASISPCLAVAKPSISNVPFRGHQVMGRAMGQSTSRTMSWKGREDDGAQRQRDYSEHIRIALPSDGCGKRICIQQTGGKLGWKYYFARRTSATPA